MIRNTSIQLLLTLILSLMTLGTQAQLCDANYLSVSGNKLYDSSGEVIRLTGINWFGFETANRAPHGLWARDTKSMLIQIKDLGFNSVRVPWSNAILEPGAEMAGISDAPVPDAYTGRLLNEVEAQLTDPLDLLDLIIDYCQELDLKVVLDNHSREPDGYLTEELWYTEKVSHEKWIEDWVFLADRYKDKDAVIAMDINNEPHGKNGSGAQWGTGDITNDWRLASEECGNAILEVNPNVLIMVEGIEEYQNETYWWGGNLKGAADHPVRLSDPSKLMYSPHEYGPTVFQQDWFLDPSFPNNMPAIWEDNFNYLLTQNISPLFAGEFGIKTQGGLDEIWFDAFLEFMGDQGYSWTFWCWNPNSGDTGGILADDWSSINQWKMDKLIPHFDRVIPNGTGVCGETYTITTSADLGGSITPEGIIEVPENANRTFTITPDAGYAIDDVVVNGVSVGAVNTYSFVGVNENSTITASFIQVTQFIIRATAGSGGNVTPAGNVLVNQGASQTFEISASSGFQIGRVIVDGVEVGQVSNYTFADVNTNHTITVTFLTDDTGQSAYPDGIPHAIPGIIDLVNFDLGGQGVAYHDTSVGNTGSGARSGENVDTEYKAPNGNIGWIATGEWLEYSVNVTQSANFDIEVLLASGQVSGAYSISFDGLDVTGEIEVPDTGGWATFMNQTISNVALTSGNKVMRIYIEDGGFNLSTITFNQIGGNRSPVALATGSPLVGVPPLTVTFDALESTDPDGDALNFSWDFGDGSSEDGAVVTHTYSSEGAYAAVVTVTDSEGASGTATVLVAVGEESSGCNFGTPLSDPLPSGNHAYTNIHVIGTGGPDLSNVTIFNINWDLANNGLWQMSMNTNNGNPSWWIDLRTFMTYELNVTQPEMLLQGTGIPGLDGSYDVNFDGDNFVMVSQSGGFTIYYSDSSDEPECGSTSSVREISSNNLTVELTSDLVLYPNPSQNIFVLETSQLDQKGTIQLFDMSGRLLLDLTKEIENERIIFGETLHSGIYLLKVEGSNKVMRILKK